MAHPGWTDIPDTDIDVDSPGDTDLFTGLRDNTRAARRQTIGFYVSTVNTTSATYALLDTVYLKVPDVDDFTSIQRILTFEAEVAVSGGGTATWKLTQTDHGGPVDSTEATTTSASFESKTVTLNIPAAAQGDIVTLEIYGKTTAGTFQLKVVDGPTSDLQF